MKKRFGGKKIGHDYFVDFFCRRGNEKNRNEMGASQKVKLLSFDFLINFLFFSNFFLKAKKGEIGDNFFNSQKNFEFICTTHFCEKFWLKKRYRFL